MSDNRHDMLEYWLATADDSDMADRLHALLNQLTLPQLTEVFSDVIDDYPIEEATR